MDIYNNGASKNGRAKKITFGENGAALLQVVFVGALLGILAYTTTLFLGHSDRSSMRVIHRNENLTYSTILADRISDKTVIRNLAIISSKDGVADRRFQ